MFTGSEAIYQYTHCTHTHTVHTHTQIHSYTYLAHIHTFRHCDLVSFPVCLLINVITCILIVTVTVTVDESIIRTMVVTKLVSEAKHKHCIRQNVFQRLGGAVC